jgi:UDP-GlcNAc:undecaprenyl-phosphate/decaprenyl-phosphate GlcNAc-1-phosphate transferase
MDTSQYMFLIYTVFFIGATLFSLLINSIFLRFAKTLGTKDQSGTEYLRWSSETKPALGGITFFMVFLISFASYSIFFEPDDVFKNQEILGLLIATIMAFVMGLADDAYNTRPLLKFTIQILCGVGLITSGSYIEIFDNLWLNYLLTAIWVIGMMNSINMLDNMDAITTVVSIFILIMSLISIYLTGNMGNAEFMIVSGVLAALVGFLFFNWYPSKIFMGDTGSQFLGIFLAYIGIKYCWNAEDLFNQKIASKQFVLVAIVFMAPIIDTTIVVINRILRGQSPFIGGKDHTTHVLSYQGMSDSQVAMCFAGISAVSLLISIFVLKYVEAWTHWHTGVFLAYFVLILVGMFYLSRLNKHKYTS